MHLIVLLAFIITAFAVLMPSVRELPEIVLFIQLTLNQPPTDYASDWTMKVTSGAGVAYANGTRLSHR